MNRLIVALVCAALLLAVVPAGAQVDLAGSWAAREYEDWQDRSPGPFAVDYLGLPLNEEGRQRALSYSASQLSMLERQCLYYPPPYVVIGPQGLRIWAESDPSTGAIIAWKISASIDRSMVTIWMDGRPRPSDTANHAFGGFTSGEWRGNTLVTTTTHFKEGPLRRNGVPVSDRATYRMYISRHDDLLTILGMIDDPLYLTEPVALSRSWQLSTNAQFTVGGPCVPAEENPGADSTTVAHYLPGENPFVAEVTQMYNLPRDAVLGGAETMYPEYRKRLRESYTLPKVCTKYCCGWQGMNGPAFCDPTAR